MNPDHIKFYLVGTNGKNSPNPSQERLAPQENAKKEKVFGQDSATRCGIANPILALTYIGASSEHCNLNVEDQKNASKSALESQRHAKEAINRVRLKKQIENAKKEKTLEEIRREDAETIAGLKRQL